MTAKRDMPIERHLTVAQVAELLGTTERFPRRLIAERRIRFVHVGRHVRIPETVANLALCGAVTVHLPCDLRFWDQLGFSLEPYLSD
jgi:excisionase family DNA binding protein